MYQMLNVWAYLPTFRIIWVVWGVNVGKYTIH